MTKPINHKSILGNEKGMVLVVTLMLTAALVLLGTTAVTTVTTDMKIASNYRESQKALYNAEAGVEQVIAYVRSSTISFPTTVGSYTNIPTLSCPAGYDCSKFTTSNVKIYYVAPRKYKFQMTGTGANNASKTIEAYANTSFSPSESVDGALAMYGNNPAIAGGGAIDGNDHSLPPTNCTGAACHTPADGPGPSLPGLFSTDTVAVGATTVTGNPAQVLNTSAEALAKDAKWTAFADDIVSSGAYDSTFSSSRDAPKITVLTSDLKLTGNNHYYGIIVVSGADVEIETTGTFTFEGLIVLANGATLTTKGTANTYGSVITCNHSELTVTLNGTPSLMYSTAAIANLSSINAPHALRKTAWRDVF